MRYAPIIDRQRAKHERRMRLENRLIEIEEQRAEAKELKREVQFRLHRERSQEFKEMTMPPEECYDNVGFYNRYGNRIGLNSTPTAIQEVLTFIKG